MPVRETGGITRANLEGVVHMRRELRRLEVALNVNRVIENATVRLRAGDRELASEKLQLDPKSVWKKSIEEPGGKATFELLDASGKVLLAHTEDKFDWAPESEIQVGPQKNRRAPEPGARTEGDWVEAGKEQELNGYKIAALETYRQGLEKFPESFLLQRAAGRLAVDLKRYDDAMRWLRAAQARSSNDEDIHYYLGLALQELGRARDARSEFEGAYRLPRLRDAARVQLGAMAAREGDRRSALEFLKGTKWELAVLRSLKDPAAKSATERRQKVDPADSFVRLESGDESLWPHLAAEPDRVIELVSRYMWLGLPGDALALLARKYPEVPAAEREPGMVLPQDHPLVSYYRGYVKQTLGKPAADDFALASKQKLDYVFPHRPAMLPVLHAALKANPADASAHFLLGSLYMSGGRVDEALAEWQQARKLNSSIPILHRNIARTLLEVKQQPERAAEVYREGLGVDAKNVELYSGLTQSLALLGKPAAERVAALEKYPDPASLPAPLVYDLALSLTEAGRFADAEKLFPGRYFAREEGGTNVREVWLEVQLQKALAGGDAKLVRELGKPVAGLDFTKDGMEAFTRGARFNYLAGVAAEKAGDKVLAEEHWKKAAANATELAYAYEAAKRLPGFDESAWRGRIEDRLRAMADDEERPGAWHVQRAMLLRALGRSDEARKAFAAAILSPERGITRYLSRVELSRAS
jgi:tetratricopeptide (TPR) repeat protein